MSHSTSSTTHGGAPPPDPQAAEPVRYGLIGVFEDVTSVTRAAETFRDAGYKRFDVHSPFPIHGIDEAIGVRPTILPWIVLAGGILGGLTGLFLTCYTMGITPHWAWLPDSFKGYQFKISAKPYFSMPAYIPPIFELTILLSSCAAFFGVWILNKLPLLAHPMFRCPSFRRATNDQFVLAVEAIDPKYDEQRTADMLRQAGAKVIEVVDE